jgi:hypothetical protein
MVGLFGWGPPHAGHGNVGQVNARIVMVVVAALGLLIAAAVFAAGNAAQVLGTDLNTRPPRAAADQRIATLRAFREISAQINAPDDAPFCAAVRSALRARSNREVADKRETPSAHWPCLVHAE